MATPNVPVDPKVITSAGGRFIRTKDGRVVEYSVRGRATHNQNASPPDGIVFVTAYVADYLLAGRHYDGDVHNQTTTISLSLPGLGHSDFHPGHDILQWPETDLLPVLEAEGVTKKFVYWGDSLGTQYAMAVGLYFGDRVLAVGLRVPFLPRHISVPHQLPQGQPTLPTAEDILRNTMSVRITRWFLQRAVGFLHPGPWTKWLIRHGFCGRNMNSILGFLEDYPAEGSYLQSMMEYFGAESMLYSCAPDVVLDSRIDPRDMHAAKVGKVVVWYAKDDDDCPPSHGKWIVEHIDCYHHRVFEGYGHVGGAFLEMDAFLAKLEECATS